MSSGAKHLKISTTLAVPLGAASVVLCSDYEVNAAFIGGLIWATFVTPDLDIDGGNITLAKIRRVSRPLAFAWRIITWPYGKLFNHRGSSHTPVWGTAVRIAYFSLLPALLLWYFYDITFDFQSSRQLQLLTSFFIAASIIDIGHIVTDYVSTFWKKFWSRRARRQSLKPLPQRKSL